MKTARFIYDNSEKNADLYYTTRFRAPDPFVYFECDGKKYVVMNDLEIDRARREAQVDEVLSINTYVARAQKKMASPGQVEVLHEMFAERRVKRLEVPQNAPFALMDALRQQGYRVEAGPSPFFPERFIKSADERRYILESQRTVFAAMKLARETLRASRIKGQALLFEGKPLTSERLRRMIDVFLFEQGFVAEGTIVSCGRHAIDPHDTGAGPLRPHQSIIVDIFPRSQKTFYFGDATRTFCKGQASEALKKMYATVKKGQALGISSIRPGINGRKIHEEIHAFFKAQGYETGEKNGRRQGFFHGTGHSIGLEIHEEPARITYRDYDLQVGNILSCEPGLYYPEIGGVRIEDLVQVVKGGAEVLAKFSKELEV